MTQSMDLTYSSGWMRLTSCLRPVLVTPPCVFAPPLDGAKVRTRSFRRAIGHIETSATKSQTSGVWEETVPARLPETPPHLTAFEETPPNGGVGSLQRPLGGIGGVGSKSKAKRPVGGRYNTPIKGSRTKPSRKPPRQGPKPPGKPPIQAPKPPGQPPRQGTRPPGQPPIQETKPPGQPPRQGTRPPGQPPIQETKPPGQPPRQGTRPPGQPPIQETKPPGQPPRQGTRPPGKPPIQAPKPPGQPPRQGTRPPGQPPRPEPKPPGQPPIQEIKPPGQPPRPGGPKPPGPRPGGPKPPGRPPIHAPKPGPQPRPPIENPKPRPRRKPIVPIIPPQPDEFGFFPKPVWNRSRRLKPRKFRRPHKHPRTSQLKHKKNIKKAFFRWIRLLRRRRTKRSAVPVVFRYTRHRRFRSKWRVKRMVWWQKRKRHNKIYRQRQRHILARLVLLPGRKKPRTRLTLTYKNFHVLKHFITLQGTIIHRNRSQLSAKKQRRVSRSIKLARASALLPVMALAD